MACRYEVHRKRIALKERAVAYKGGGCTICGYSKCLAAMDFHHPCDFTKEFNISSRKAWTDKLQRELDVTILLCSRCHREVHDGLHPFYLERL